MASDWTFLSVEAIRAPKSGSIAIGPFGSRMKSDLYVPTGVPVIRGNNLTDSKALAEDFVYVSEDTADALASSNVFPGDLVFPHRGAIGRVGIVPGDGPARYVMSTSLMKLTVDTARIDPTFLFYFFRSELGRAEILANASTVGTPGIGQPLASLRRIAVPVPPMPEQRAIAEILGALDDKIDLNRRMNETLEAIARALFKSWFVDFEPVYAKSEGRATGLPKHLADLFPDSLDDSELGAIPAGWSVGIVADVAEINAQTLTASDQLDVIDYVEISEVMRGEIRAVPRYARGKEPSRARRRLRHGDTVLSTVRPDRGAHFLCLDPSSTLLASTGFAVLSPRDGAWAFLYSAMTRTDVGEELGRLADGGAYPAIRPDVIGALKIVVPNRSGVVSAFQRLASPLFTRVAQGRQEATTLAALRDTLLPKLMAGEVRVNATS